MNCELFLMKQIVAYEYPLLPPGGHGNQRD